MAYDLDIRFRCRTHYEMYGKNLKEIKDIEFRINEITPYKNRKYEIDEEKEQIEKEIKRLELEKKILIELQETIKNEDIQNKEIEIKNKFDKVTVNYSAISLYSTSISDV